MVPSGETTGAVSLSAGEDFNAGTNQAGHANSNLTMDDGVTISSANGRIELEATDDILLSIVTTAGNVTVSADDNDFSLADNVGTITDNLTGEGGAAVNITGATVDLDAVTGIGSGGTLDTPGDIDINGTTLSAVNSTSGTINICLLYTSPSPRDGLLSRMPSSA